MNYTRAVKKYFHLLLLANLCLFFSMLCMPNDTDSCNEHAQNSKKREALFYRNLKYGSIAAALYVVGSVGWSMWYHADDLDCQLKVQQALARKEDIRPFLWEAASKGYWYTLGTLLRANVELNAKNELGEFPLYMAVKGGHMSAIKLLVDAGANIHATTNNGGTLFEAAAQLNDSKQKKPVIQYLIDKGVAVDRYSKQANALLHKAICNQEVELVDFLIKKGVDVNLVNSEGYSPLVAALALHSKKANVPYEPGKKIIQLLVQTNKCKINAFTKNGLAPLHLAIEYDLDNDIIQLLIKYGANVNVRSKIRNLSRMQNMNPLFFALSKRRLEVIRTLLDAGAKPRTYMEDGSGNAVTPYEVASEIGLRESIALLPECTGLELMTEKFRREQDSNLRKRTEPERITNANIVWFMRHSQGDAALPSAYLLSKIKTNCAISGAYNYPMYQPIASI